MKNNRRWTFPLNTATWMSVSLAGMALLAGCATKQPEVKPTSTGWVKNQVADAYTFGFPLVASDIARERASGRTGQPGQTPLNTFRYAIALPLAGAAGWPSVDTLESTAWFDVFADSVIVCCPPRRTAAISTPARSTRGPTRSIPAPTRRRIPRCN